MPTLCAPSLGDDTVEIDDEEDIGVNPKDLVLHEPIVGQKPLPSSPIRPLPQPTVLTEAQMEEHMITHLPFCNGYPFCVAGARNNTPHRTSTNTHILPNISMDYGFLQDSISQDSVTFLGVYVRPFRLYFPWLFP